MKLLVVTSFFPTSNTDEVPQFLLEQVIAFSKTVDDIKIKVLSTSRPHKGDLLLPSNVEVKRFSYFYPIKKQNLTNLGILPAINDNKFNMLQIPLLFMTEFIAIVKAIYKFKPDYIYSHWFLPQGILCHIASKLFKIPHLFTSHSFDVEICNKIPLIGPFAVRSAIKHMHSITVVSERTLLGMSKFFSESEWDSIRHKCKIIPMGIKIPERESLNQNYFIEKYKFLKGCKVIFFMGRLVEKKGIELLIYSFKKLYEKNPQTKLVLSGNGILKNKIIKLIASLDLEDEIVLSGFISNEEKDFLLNRADVFVLPSIDTQTGDREGLPVSLLESMAYGNICIASDVSGATEVIEDKVNGYIIKSGDENGIYEMLEYCINLDIKKSKKIKSAAVIAANNYSWDNIISRQSEHFFADHNTYNIDVSHKPSNSS